LTWLWPGIVVGDRGKTVSARAVEWLENAADGMPFFLWIHYIDPHAPYSVRGVDPNKSFRTDSLFGGTDGETDFELRSPDVARLRSGEIRLGDEEKDLVRSLYRAEVRAVDAAVGMVLDALDETGLGKNTLVVLTADHGEEFWEHGGVEHGHTLYDELLLVPFIVRWPGRLPDSTRVDDLVRLVDVVPTILHVLDLPIPDELNGRSAVPLLSGADSPPRIAWAENMLFTEERTAIRTSDHKYIRWQDGREEVYDLRADP
jgi:arylsulfatase A-like enzyme